MADEIIDGDSLIGTEKIELCRKIVRERQYQKIRYHFHNKDGTVNVRTFLLDGVTAQAICHVYDALSPENQQKFCQKPLIIMADMAWRLTG